MTIYLRDMSHFDSNESLAGFVGATHKVTEGSSFVDTEFARRMNAYRGAGVKVLGSYHVLHTGNLAAQLDHWLSTLDRLTPWWRTFPHWIMQVDAERWPTDNVSPATVTAFARMLVGSDAPGWKVTYASRGQYGNSLAGIATYLWNAAYHSASYPGDGAADWVAYSGRVPVLWQFTSSPFDKNAYRGTLDELLALIGGTTDMELTDKVTIGTETKTVKDLLVDNWSFAWKGGGPFAGALKAALADVHASAGPTQEQVNAAVAAVMNDASWLAALGSELAKHIKVS